MLYVVAMPSEIELIKPYSDWNGKGPVLVTGAGAVNVIQALRDVPRNTMIMNVGYAGSNKIPVGTRCYIGKVRMYHPAAKIEDPVFDLNGTVPCYTAGDFVTETDIDEPCVFDMELAYILAMGFERVYAVKVVSDNLDYDEFEKNAGDMSGE